MVSNKNRKTNYQDLSVTKEAAEEFAACSVPGETKTDTLLKILKVYKSKCLDHAGPGVCVAD